MKGKVGDVVGKFLVSDEADNTLKSCLRLADPGHLQTLLLSFLIIRVLSFLIMKWL